MRNLLLSLSLVAIAFMNSYSQERDSTIAKRIYTTKPIGDVAAPKIDGDLNEKAWELVEWSGNFIEFRPDTGTPPTEQTLMKILYDDKNLYIAFKCFQEDPATIERRLGRRDTFPGDWVEINIDSYNDDRTAFSFTASSSGVKSDEFVSNNDNFDSSWNPIWYLSTKVNEDSWTAEIRVPLSQLRFSKAQDQVWGLQATRRYFNNEERSLWQEIDANPPGWVSEFGELHGLIGLKPQKQLEIQPYSLSQLDTYEKEPGNPFRDGSDSKFAGGLDAKIGITNDLTLDLTINPDFGQVDADPGAIALDGFEIFFQERRPFFVENKNVFDFRLGGGPDNLFFSRRIGRTPQGFTTADSNLGEFEDIPNFTTILGAAKFSGKTANGWSIGLLESVTAKEFGEIKLDNRPDVINGLPVLGTERKEIVEPMTNYLVGRLQKDFNDRNSYVGGIFTATNRNLEGNLDFLHKSAYSGGLDFKHNWKNRTYYVEGVFSFSKVLGSEDAIEQTQRSLTHLFQRTDAGHVEVDSTRTSLSGTGGRIEIGKSGGGNWRYNLGGFWKSPELELNDIGFLRQADDFRQYANVRRVFNKPTSWFRQATFGAEFSTAFDFEGNYNRIQYEAFGFVNFTNNYFVDFGAAHKPRIFVNTFLRGGPRWRYNEENYWFLFVGTDQRKKLSVVAGTVNSQATQDNFSFYRYRLSFNYQPINAMSISLDTEYSQNPSRTQYVNERSFNGQPRYILGAIDQETLSTTLRINYNLNPDLSLQYYAQPFIFKADFSDFNYVVNSTASNLENRISLFDGDQIQLNNGSYEVDEDRNGLTDYSFADPDFVFVQFRSNLVLRWEYIPGSEIFLVWSQGITASGDVNNNFGTIIEDQLLNQKANNTFLLKATYRFNL
ncbi:MAG: carbohydrate binding family 9 domain-containing protein [Muriicola sp.]|nr:carbohydrate binding family 9 domain-containing protein [Muriicola sp.]